MTTLINSSGLKCLYSLSVNLLDTLYVKPPSLNLCILRVTYQEETSFSA